MIKKKIKKVSYDDTSITIIYMDGSVQILPNSTLNHELISELMGKQSDLSVLKD